MPEKYCKLLITDTTRNWNGSACWFAVDRVTPLTDPTSADNVHMDAATFLAAGQSLVVNSTANCLNMDWTGATNSPRLGGASILYIYGDLTLISAMTVTNNSALIAIGSVQRTWTTNNLDLSSTNVYMYDGGLNLIGSLLPKSLVLSSGTFTSNNNTITTAGKVQIDTASAKTVTLGSSIINCGLWSYLGSNLTLTANTATINCSASFSGGGITTYNIVNITVATSTISGNNTFAQLNGTPAITQTLTFTDGSTQTVTTSSNLSGTAGHIHTLTGTSTGGWMITKSGGGTILASYVTIKYSQASPVSTFYARPPSTNGGGNTGWIFPSSQGNNVLEQALMAGLI